MTTKDETTKEIPRETIDNLSGTYTECLVKVSRQLPSGQWNALNGSGQSRMTADMVHPESWLEENWGGGRFRVQLFDPTHPARPLVSGFMVPIDGMPKAKEPTVAQQSHAEAHVPPYGYGMPPAAHQRQLGPQQGQPGPQWPAVWPYGPFGGPGTAPPPQYFHHEEFDPRVGPGQYWESPPDAVASRQVEQLREDLRTEREDHKRERLAAETRARQLAEELQRTRSENEKALFEAKIEAVRAEVRSTQQQPQRPGVDVVALIAALAPIATAVIESAAARADVGQRRESTAIEVQSKAFTSMIESMKKTDDGGMIKLVLGLAPVLSPLVLNWMSERSPSKQMEIMSAMTENQMMGLSTVAQMLDKLSQADNAPPWVGLAVNFIESLQTVAHTYIADKTRKPPQQVAASQGANGRAEPVQHPDAETVVTQLMTHESFPKALVTDEWRELLIEVHEADHETVRETAKKLAGMLQAMKGQKSAPAEVKEILKDASQVGPQFLFRLPIAAIDQDYAVSLAEFVQVEMAVPADAKKPTEATA